MRVFVKVCVGKGVKTATYTIPCNGPTDSVGELKRRALDHWLKDKGEKTEEWKADRFDLTLSENGALLSDTDPIQKVLRDGEFVELCKRDVRTFDFSKSAICFHTGRFYDEQAPFSYAPLLIIFFLLFTYVHEHVPVQA